MCPLSSSTFLSAAEVAAPEGAGPDSIDQLPLLLRPSDAKPIRHAMVYGSGRGLRAGPWVYLAKQGSMGQFSIDYMKRLGFINSDFDREGNLRPDAPPAQLYRISDDPQQTTNLFEEYPGVVHVLDNVLQNILKERYADKPIEFYLPADRISGYAFAAPATWQQHELNINGVGRQRVVATEFGSLKTEYTVRELGSEGAELTFALSMTRPQPQPVVLEIEEIHNRRDETLAYQILAGDQPVYFRTYQEIGSGPNVYYVQLPADAVNADGEVTVTFRNLGGGPVWIHRIRAYADFAKLAEADQTWQKMPYLQAPFIALAEKGRRFNWHEKRAAWMAREDQPLWPKLKEALQDTPFTPGLHDDVGYAHSTISTREVVEKVGGFMDVAIENGVALQFVFNGGDWGGHPEGPNGLGGYFSDVEYSQIQYDRQADRYAPSWPGTPGNAIWGNRNGKNLREFLRERMRIAGDAVTTWTALQQAMGRTVPPFYYVLDQGPGGGSFDPGTLSAAARHGVKLDPRDGLSVEERLWMHRDLAAAVESQGRGMTEGIGRNHILVKGSEITYPEEQYADNVYAHPFYDPADPCFDDRWAGYQWGVGPHQWTGGETLDKIPLDYYDYVAAIGKLTCVNLERVIADFSHIGTMYELGFQFVTIYNGHGGDLDELLAKHSGLDQRSAMPTRSYDRRLFHANFAFDDGASASREIVRRDNLELQRQSLVLRDRQQPGIITCKIGDGVRPLGAGIKVYLDFGKPWGSLPRIGKTQKIIVSAGDSQDAQQIVQELHYADFAKTAHWPFYVSATVDLGDSLQGLTEGYVTVRFDMVAADTHLHRVQIVEPWPLPSGHSDLAQPFTVKQMRTMRLHTQQRAVYYRLRERYLKSGGAAGALAEADALADIGLVKQAYRKLSAAWSLILPARFAVQGTGKLAAWPIEVENVSKPELGVLVELIRAEADDLELVLTSQEAQTARLRFSQLAPGTSYNLDQAWGNRIRLTVDADGQYRVNADGCLVVSLDLAAWTINGDPGWLAKASGRVPTRQLTARQLGQDRYELQDSDLWMYSPIRIPRSKDAKIIHQLDGSTDKPDLATGLGKWEISLDDDGYLREAVATYGEDTGKIKSFTPPACYPVACNGIIELENGKRYELMFRNRFSNIRMTEEQKQGWPHSQVRRLNFEELSQLFKPGVAVRLHYSPYTWNVSLPRIISVESME